MEERQTLTGVMCRSLSGLDRVFATDPPDMAIVQGDTLAVAAGAMAAFFHQVPAGHVEAGLRTNNRYGPFPEEMNRRLAAQLCTVHFAPTTLAKENLIHDGVPEENIYLTGNTATDAIKWIAENRGDPEDLALTPLGQSQSIPFKELISRERLIAVTAHRRENIPDRLRQICEALRRICERDDVGVVFAVHPGPAVRDIVAPILGHLENVALVEPPDYADFASIMVASYFVLTDSGGLQEEAPTLKKPILVVRETTERPEGVDAGVARLIGTQTDTIIAEASKLLDDPNHYAAMTGPPNPYGDGECSPRILRSILHFFGRANRPVDIGT